MPVVKVLTNFNIDLEFQIPEFWRRLVALLMDILLLYFYAKIADFIYTQIGTSSGGSDIDTNYNMQWLALILFYMPILLYHLICDLTLNGQSIGKKIMGIRVVNELGGRPSIGQFIIRWLIRISDMPLVIILYLYLEYGSIIFAFPPIQALILISFIGLITDTIIILNSKKGQRLGDILAKTMLIHVRATGYLYDTVFQEVSDSYIPKFPEIMKLNDKDINAIKNILDTARKKGDFNMAASASEKIKSHLKIDSALSPFDFLDTALKDYNYLSTK